MRLLCKCGKCLTEDLYQVNPKYNKDGRTTNNKMFDKGTKEVVEYINLKGEKCEDVWYERGNFKKGVSLLILELLKKIGIGLNTISQVI